MIVVHPDRTTAVLRTCTIAPTTPALLLERMAYHEHSQMSADASVYKSSGNLTCFYGCGKGLSIAAPCYENPHKPGFQVSVCRMNPRGPLRAHLGVNKGSFSVTSPIRTEAVQPQDGGRFG